MSESTKRAIRTTVQFIAALLVAWPIIAIAFDGTSVAGAVAVVGIALATIAKVQNALEDAGVWPSWLKSAPAAAGPVD